MFSLPRFAVLQVVLLAGCLALYLAGNLSAPFTGEAKWFSIAVLLFAGFGLVCISRQAWEDASWISERLVRIGVIAMQVGIFSAVSTMGMKLMGNSNIMQIAGVFMSSMSVGFTVSIMALTANLWLDLNIKLLGGEDA